MHAPDASTNAPTASPQASASAGDVAAAMLDVLRACMRPGGGGIWQLLEDLGLSFPQIKMLAILDAVEGDLSVKEVSEHVGMSLPNASRTVDGLVKLGHLDRREDPADRRSKRVAVTAAGREAVRRFEDVRFEGMRAWAETLTPEQRGALSTVLRSLPPHTLQSKDDE